MTDELAKQINDYRNRGYSMHETAKLCGVTTEDVRIAAGNDWTKDENEVIDGEPIAERIVRMKRELWNKHLDDMRNGKSAHCRDREPFFHGLAVRTNR